MPFFVDLFIVAIAVSVVLLFDTKSVWLKLLLIATVFFCAVRIYSTATEIAGYPAPRYVSQEEVQVIAIEIVVPTVYVWYWDRNANRPRAVEFTLTKEQTEKMKAAQKRIAGGQGVWMQFKQNPYSSKEYENYDDVEVYNFSKEFHTQKD